MAHVVGRGVPRRGELGPGKQLPVVQRVEKMISKPFFGHLGGQHVSKRKDDLVAGADISVVGIQVGSSV